MEQPGQLSRRDFLAGTVSLAAGISLAGCSPDRTAPTPAPSSQVQPGAGQAYPIGAYLEDYNDQPTLEGLAARPDLDNALNRVHMAFAVPAESGTVDPPLITAPYIQALGAIGSHNELAVAVGGWSVADEQGDDGRKTMERRLRQIFAAPERFVDATLAMHSRLADELQLPVRALGLDIDLEWPDASEADSMVGIMSGLRRALPQNRLFMAIPPGDQPGYHLEALAEDTDVFHLMTYDYGDPAVSSYIAPLPSVVADVDLTVRRVGNAAQVAVGFPGYGRRYAGATARGQALTAPARDGQEFVKLKDVPPASINPDGEAIVHGAWTSLVTPAMARLAMGRILNQHPAIGGAFIWNISGTPYGYVQELRRSA